MSTSSHSLCIDNHSSVYFACENICPKWEDLAARLSVSRSSVGIIRADGKDSTDCLRKLLDEWLKRSSPEQPLPSWRVLCDALTHLDPPLSKSISAQHQCVCSLCTGRDGEAPIGLVSPLYNEIYQKLKNPMGVAEYMYSERAFSLLQLKKIRDSPGNEKEVLLTSLESAVSSNRYNLRVFGKALMKEEATHSLGKSLLVNCRKEEFPSQSKIKKIVVERKYKKEFQSMRTALGQLCASTVTLLSEQNIDVAELKNQLEFSFPELGSDLEKCSSLNEVVKNVIRRRVSLVQIDYLEAVFDLFKLAKRSIQEYNRKVDELYETVKIEYGQLLMEEFDSSNISELESIEFVLGWDENECLLKDIHDLFDEIVEQYSSRVKVIIIHKGNSIVVKCCVPAHLLPVITRMIQDSEAILNREKVISVIAGGRTIFKRIVTVEQKAELEIEPKKENNYEVVDKSSVHSSDDTVAPSSRVEKETKVNQELLTKEKMIKMLLADLEMVKKKGKILNLELLSKEKMVEMLSAELEMIKEKGKKMKETVMMKDSMIKEMSAELDELKNRKDPCVVSEGEHSEPPSQIRKSENEKRLEETVMMKDSMIKQMSAELEELKNRKDTPGLSDGLKQDVTKLENELKAFKSLSQKLYSKLPKGPHPELNEEFLDAAESGNVSVVIELLSMGVDANCNNELSGGTVLMKASARGHSDVVQLLISAGASLDEKDSDGCTALMIASAGGHSDVVRLLISAGARLDEKDNYGDTALIKASTKGHCEVVKLLLSAQASVNQSGRWDSTALMRASAGGHSDVVKLLISAGARLDEKGPRGSTALMKASAHGHSDVVQLLISAGARLDEKNKWGYTALMKASANGISDVVQLLISAGSSLDDKDDRSGYTALMKASASGHSDVVQLLISAGASLDKKNDWSGETALMNASARGHSDVVQLLISAGARLDEKDNWSGVTALMNASAHGHSDVVQLLISAGARLDEQDKRSGETALMKASAGGHSDVVQLLISAGASLDEKDDWDYTALMKASARGHSDVVQLLISAGARLDEKDDDGCTALMKASAGGHSDVVQLLISAGARLDEKDKRQQSAIYLASAGRHVDVVKALLSTGRVDLRATDQYGQSPIMIAKVLGHHDLIELFVSTGLVSRSELDKYSLPEGWSAVLDFDGKLNYYKTSDSYIHHKKHPLFEDV